MKSRKKMRQEVLPMAKGDVLSLQEKSLASLAAVSTALT